MHANDGGIDGAQNSIDPLEADSFQILFLMIRNIPGDAPIAGERAVLMKQGIAADQKPSLFAKQIEKRSREVAERLVCIEFAPVLGPPCFGYAEEWELPACLANVIRIVESGLELDIWRNGGETQLCVELPVVVRADRGKLTEDFPAYAQLVFGANALGIVAQDYS